MFELQVARFWPGETTGKRFGILAPKKRKCNLLVRPAGQETHRSAWAYVIGYTLVDPPREVAYSAPCTGRCVLSHCPWLAKSSQSWTGTATKTIDPSSNQDKNQKNLDKAMQKLLKDYPPKQK